MELFVSGATARCAAKPVEVDFKTTAYSFHLLQTTSDRATQGRMSFAGETEVDERDIGGIRQGKRGQGAAGKVPVLGWLKRGG